MFYSWVVKRAALLFIACSRHSDRRAQAKLTWGGGKRGEAREQKGGGGGGSLAIVPVSPCFCPIFHAYDLTRSPPSECRLYVLKVWNRLCYSSQVVCFCCPFYRVFITLDIIILRMSSFSALLPLLYCMFFQQNKTIDHFTVILAFE